MKECVAVTGAAGFIGRELCQTLVNEGFAVRALQREREFSACDSIEYVPTGDIGSHANLFDAMLGVSAVVHLAGRAHQLDENCQDAMDAYHRINVEATRRVADAAVRAGVKRLVFLSTVKVHGERTDSKPFSEKDSLNPSGAYAISKRKAEISLEEVARSTNLDVVVIRPPLVYGPGVRANFLRLMRLVDRGAPLPLGLIKNRRSMVGLGNLVAMIVVCIRNPRAAGETFLVSDGEDLSTPQLVRKIAASLDRRCVLVPVPQFLLQIAAQILGKREVAGRLVDSLQVETAKAKTLLGWKPPFSFDAELIRTCEWYRSVYRTT
jgi:UDP-4-keto-D-QuiNAc 4-reductase